MVDPCRRLYRQTRLSPFVSPPAHQGCDWEQLMSCAVSNVRFSRSRVSQPIQSCHERVASSRLACIGTVCHFAELDAVTILHLSVLAPTGHTAAARNLTLGSLGVKVSTLHEIPASAWGFVIPLLHVAYQRRARKHSTGTDFSRISSHRSHATRGVCSHLRGDWPVFMHLMPLMLR